MQYREDAKAGEELSALGFGCMRFPGGASGIDIDASEKLVLAAVDAGVNYFDTAYLYNGNEKALCQIMSRNPGLREKVNIATKIPIARCDQPSDLGKYLDRSLDRLGTDHVEYYLIHNVTSKAAWQKLESLGFAEWVDEQKRSGRIGQMGFSYHGPESDFEEFLDAYDWDFCQIQYNYMNEHFQAGTAGLDAAAARAIPVIVMEPLLGGKLAAPLPEEARRILAEGGCSEDAVKLALRWVWNHPAVTVVLSGMNSMQQLDENVATVEEALPHSLTDAEFAAIDVAKGAIARSFKVGCTGCGYCMPCPFGVNIPMCFAAYNTSYAYGWFEGMQQYVTASGVMVGDAHFASDCTKCGACVKKCPQHIAIPDELVKAKHRLQPPGLPAILRFGARLISR